MPSYKILKEEAATMDGVAGVVYEVELKADNDYAEVQKYFATPETKSAVLEEATKSFQNNQPVVADVIARQVPIEVQVSL